MTCKRDDVLFSFEILKNTTKASDKFCRATKRYLSLSLEKVWEVNENWTNSSYIVILHEEVEKSS